MGGEKWNNTHNYSIQFLERIYMENTDAPLYHTNSTRQKQWHQNVGLIMKNKQVFEPTRDIIAVL